LPNQQNHIVTINPESTIYLKGGENSKKALDTDVFRATMPGLDSIGYKTHRVVPKHKKGYLEMKKQVNELVHDY